MSNKPTFKLQKKNIILLYAILVLVHPKLRQNQHLEKFSFNFNIPQNERIMNGQFL